MRHYIYSSELSYEQLETNGSLQGRRSGVYFCVIVKGIKSKEEDMKKISHPW